MTAINKGKVIDTSMGMTPLEGLVMGTRSGDIDPAIVLTLIDRGMSPQDVDQMLNKKSGLFGVAGISSGDMREIIQSGEKGNLQSVLALKLFVNRIIKYIGAYYAMLNGADAIVFTGGIGENSYIVREKVLEQISAFSVYLDPNINSNCVGTPAIISTKESKMKAIVMPTNEELMIATQSIDLLLSEGRLKLVAI
jgi:acetate kinase